MLKDACTELIPKPLSTTIGWGIHGSALSAKKVLDVQEVRLRAFSTSSLDHELFAQSRYKTGSAMSYSVISRANDGKSPANNVYTVCV